MKIQVCNVLCYMLTYTLYVFNVLNTILSTFFKKVRSIKQYWNNGVVIRELWQIREKKTVLEQKKETTVWVKFAGT